MKIRYTGESDVSFEHGDIYDVKEISDSIGNGYSVKDESGEWYRYGKEYVERNFDIHHPLLPDATEIARKIAVL
ncbi:MAG TPA: hypothetical protein DEP57_05675 [Selenomonas sp.]|nr:hypothetical protein [Selenomonadaceae bacterium]HCB93286.1 hypothetical protein [Selenomonas sp.]